MKQKIKIFLAAPRGFCAGVDRAIEIVKKTLNKYGSPVYVRHEIVHNKNVVEDLKNLGAIFVEEISEKVQTKFIIITHNRMTMSRVDRLYGVTMPEEGVSQIVSVELEEAVKEGQGLTLVAEGRAGGPLHGSPGRYTWVSAGNVNAVDAVAGLAAVSTLSLIHI